MTNTQQRVVSALVLLFIFLLCLFLGKLAMLVLVGVTGALLVDEMCANMLRVPRSHFSYIVSQLSFIAGYSFFNFIEKFVYYETLILNAGMTLSLLLIFYLFLERMDSKLLIRLLKKNSYIVGVFVLLPILCFGTLIHQDRWVANIFLILILNSSVDIGAWFFGKNFGKRKLWPKISPNKTLTGLVGGVISSVVLSTIYILVIYDKVNFQILLALAGLGILAQIGDLIESKMKRQLKVKDSSNLIPGHGGIYDRIDSLVFIAPFFALLVRDLL
ncbi:MAG: hypothetical protein CME65_07280 [Halobacteriovoraceae bacterium]|nr:hypothetical protein [Halobacteriovoraceae bacterium]|tara:strand:+ start:1200 stop:2018 length:819 start_codon:yes stop_codon:yes gene_type:complete